jgi:hypothetical protein
MHIILFLNSSRFYVIFGGKLYNWPLPLSLGALINSSFSFFLYVCLLCTVVFIWFMYVFSVPLYLYGLCMSSLYPCIYMVYVCLLCTLVFIWFMYVFSVPLYLIHKPYKYKGTEKTYINHINTRVQRRHT